MYGNILDRKPDDRVLPSTLGTISPHASPCRYSVRVNSRAGTKEMRRVVSHVMLAHRLSGTHLQGKNLDIRVPVRQPLEKSGYDLLGAGIRRGKGLSGERSLAHTYNSTLTPLHHLPAPCRISAG